MKNLYAQLNDLPDEIIMIIFKKLTKVEVLYSLFDVNKRLNRIAHDIVFINDLPLLISTPDDFIYPLPEEILDRFCSYILPKIHEKIEWLHLESQSMERVLLATNYPNLYGISLHNIQPKMAIHLFTDENSSIAKIKNQILSLTIDINTQGIKCFSIDSYGIILNHILTMFTNLQYLNFGGSSVSDERLFFSFMSSTAFSTNLLELHVCLKTFYDCIYLLDENFNQLQILHVDVCLIVSSDRRNIISKKKLRTLKSFCLHCDSVISTYDELVLPLLHRMPNLEKLDLNLNVTERKTFFDGNDLKMNIINYMSQLNQFTFSICSSSNYYNEINLPTNEDIQNTFTDFNNKEIIYWADYFPEKRKGYCHVYSNPYKLKYYENITNNFPGQIYKYVRRVSLYDERPFEHEFFLRIAESFPLMEHLSVSNQKQQINKQFDKSKNLSIIKYPYLKILRLDTCIDYYEQFLLDAKTCLPFDVIVGMRYGLVKQVTHNFTSDATRNNCAKVDLITLRLQIKPSLYEHDLSIGKEEFRKHLKEYFPRTQID